MAAGEATRQRGDTGARMWHNGRVAPAGGDRLARDPA